MHRMNHPDGKRLLARVRGCDYAHAGEEESISLVWEGLPKNPSQLCLDAGCGRGGTAAFIQNHGWGQVTGIDIDETSIAAAQENHPGVTFRAADVTTVGGLLPDTFDIAYAFNAFYAFPDQSAALRSLRKTVKDNGTLAIFDYVDQGTFRESELFQKPETRFWQPLILKNLSSQLAATGWRLTACRELHADYLRWYTDLVERFERLRGDLQEEFSPEWIDYAAGYYQSLLKAVESGSLGGAVVCASTA